VLSDRDWTHPQGGRTGTNLHAQVTRWLAAGHRVTIVACSYDGAQALERDGKLTRHRIGGPLDCIPARGLEARRGKLVPDADVVLGVINGITVLTPLWLRKPRVAQIHHIRRDHYVRELGRLGRVAAPLVETLPLRLLYRTTRFVTVSESSAADIAARWSRAGA